MGVNDDDDDDDDGGYGGRVVMMEQRQWGGADPLRCGAPTPFQHSTARDLSSHQRYKVYFGICRASCSAV